MYPFINKPTNATFWKYSQIYDIEFHESLNNCHIYCHIYQTKLFLFNSGLMTQWDLLAMTVEMQYNADIVRGRNIVVNKNQTLLALLSCNNQIYQIDIYSMETRVHVSRRG